MTTYHKPKLKQSKKDELCITKKQMLFEVGACFTELNDTILRYVVVPIDKKRGAFTIKLLKQVCKEIREYKSRSN